MSDKLVDQLADEMRKGRWRVTGQGITFDKQGVLIDGQHRLWAVIHAQVEARMLVLRNAESDTLACVDTGRTRSVSDVMKLMDGTASASKVKAMLATIDMLHNGYRRLSYFETRELLKRYQEGIDWAVKVFASRSGTDAPYVSGALAFAYPTDPVAIDEFAVHVRSGINLQDGDPALALRNYLLLRKPNIREDRRSTALKVLRAAMAKMRGERITRIEAVEAGFSFFDSHYRNEKVAVLPIRRKGA